TPTPPPTPTIKFQSPLYVGTVGDQLVLTVNVQNVSGNQTYKWTGPTAEKVLPNHTASLLLPDLAARDAGVYEASVTDGGVTVSDAAEVRVQAPTVWHTRFAVW